MHGHIPVGDMSAHSSENTAKQSTKGVLLIKVHRSRCRQAFNALMRKLKCSVSVLAGAAAWGKAAVNCGTGMLWVILLSKYK